MDHALFGHQDQEAVIYIFGLYIYKISNSYCGEVDLSPTQTEHKEGTTRATLLCIRIFQSQSTEEIPRFI